MSELYLMDLQASNPAPSDRPCRKCPACGEMMPADDNENQWLEVFPDLVICPLCAADLDENLARLNLEIIDRRLA